MIPHSRMSSLVQPYEIMYLTLYIVYICLAKHSGCHATDSRFSFPHFSKIPLQNLLGLFSPTGPTQFNLDASRQILGHHPFD